MVKSDTFPDNYADYWTIVQTIHSGVSSDAITLRKRKDKSKTGKHVTYTRDQLATKLAKSHGASRTMTRSNEAFSGTAITQGEINSAMSNPSSYGSTEDWMAWAGVHEGRWYDTYKKNVYEDDATWYRPDTESSSKYNSDTLHQAVQFREDETFLREGWNESNPDAAFVWGWDPKDWDPTDHGYGKGYVGTHVGYPFSKGDASCIVWITPQVAFLEVIKPHADLPRRLRTSVTPKSWDWGYGQWSVKLRDGMLIPASGL